MSGDRVEIFIDQDLDESAAQLHARRRGLVSALASAILYELQRGGS